MIDTHAHLNFSEFEKDLDEVISKSFSEGLENIIVASSSLKSSKKALEIAEKDGRIFASIGIHPHDIDRIGDFGDIEKMANNKKVVVIGETGLDYFYLSSCHSREGGNPDFEKIKKKQKKLLEKHIELAKRLDFPLIFHNRDSDEDFYEIVKDKNVQGVLHCYTGNWDFAKKILDLGFLLSFTGIITFPKAEVLYEVVKNIPLDRLMVETDAPFLAPIPYRGKRAEPWMVREVIKKIADIKGLSFEEVDVKTSSNAKDFFGI